MHSVSASTSTITGVALTDSTALALATNVMPGTITSSPSPMPQATSAASSVCVPFVNGSPPAAPWKRANSPAKRNARSPSPVHQPPESSVASNSSRSRSPHCGHDG